MIEQRRLCARAAGRGSDRACGLVEHRNRRPADPAARSARYHSRCSRHSLPGESSGRPPESAAPRPSACPCGTAADAPPRTHRAPTPRHNCSASQHPPHCRGRSSRNCESFSRTIDFVRQSRLAAILGKQRQRLRPIDLLVQHLDRFPPRELLRGVDLAEVSTCRCTTRPPARACSPPR